MPNRAGRAAALVALLAAGTAAPAAAAPATPDALVTAVAAALSTRDLAAYAVLLAPGFEYRALPEVADSALSREAELALMGPLFATDAELTVEFQIQDRTAAAGGARLTVLASFLLRRQDVGYRLSVQQSLVVAQTEAGWLLAAWAEVPALGVSTADWSRHAVRQTWAARTAVAPATWGSLKDADRGAGR